MTPTCPWCGSEMTPLYNADSSFPRWSAHCGECFASGPEAKSPDSALAAARRPAGAVTLTPEQREKIVSDVQEATFGGAFEPDIQRTIDAVLAALEEGA